MAGDKIIDAHVHMFGPGDKYPGELYWNERFTDSSGFKLLKFLKGWSDDEMKDESIEAEFKTRLQDADHVDAAVALALDHVYGPDGTLIEPDGLPPEQVPTTLYVSNAYVDRLREQSNSGGKRILAGISVHPFRESPRDEFDKYGSTAALCKWIPSAQQIDFEAPGVESKLMEFYAILAAINLPLLFHAGTETSIPSADPKFERLNNPVFIETALDLGVTVIIAHCGCSYFDVLVEQDNVVQTVVNMFQKMQGEKQDWKLYADLSAVFSPFRKRRILDEIFSVIPVERLIYGSDYPNPTKGCSEFFLGPFFEFSSVNLLEHYYENTQGWLEHYHDEGILPDGYERIFTNFHGLLKDLGRGYLLE